MLFNQAVPKRILITLGLLIAVSGASYAPAVTGPRAKPDYDINRLTPVASGLMVHSGVMTLFVLSALLVSI